MFEFMIFFFIIIFFMSEKSILTKKSQKNKLICVLVYVWFVICVSIFVVVIFGCKIDFFFLKIGSQL